MQNILVIIDMQKDFIDGSLANPDANSIVPKVCELIKNPNGYTRIILTRDTHGYNYLDTAEGRNLDIPHCINGTEGWLVDSRIREALLEVVTKTNSPDIIAYLDKPTFGTCNWPTVINASSFDVNSGADLHITLCGTCTDICVVSNALILKAIYPEATIDVVSSACAGTTEKNHEAALKVMGCCQINIL